MPRISKTTVEAIKPDPEKDVYLWDEVLKGFGLKVTKKGSRTYLVQYRQGGRTGRTRRITIGKHGTITAEIARKEAKKILGLVAAGNDPAEELAEQKRDITVGDLCDRYISALESGEVLNRSGNPKQSSTISTDKGRIQRHIKPLLGRKRVNATTRQDIERFMRDVAAGKTATDVKTKTRGRAIVRGGKGTATRTVGLLGGIFTFAIDQGITQDNPVRGVKRYPDKKGERYLSEDEIKRLGNALNEFEKNGTNKHAINGFRLLCLTGCRRGEIERLKWSEVDFENCYLRLSQTKTGKRDVRLGVGALGLLKSLYKTANSEFVFPGENGGHYQGQPKVWAKIRKKAKIEDVRIHDLRHSFASIGVASGLSLPMIGTLLGHSNPATTQRYAHLSDDPLGKAADEINSVISLALFRG